MGVAFLTRKGASVARERPTASDVSQIPAVLDIRPERDGRERVDGLTRAQAHALRRCAPLTSADFKEHRRAVQQHMLSLRHVLARGAGDGGTSPARSVPPTLTRHD
ncbi:MAG TPA: hypothetical protein VGO81_07715 [Solirubrobacteraceae bacterium]|nr:hypothetical protein [Solirubrobacteraceae bacterium]